MYRGFSNSFTFDAYNLIYIRHDQPDFQKIIIATAAEDESNQVAFLANAFKELIDRQLINRKVVSSIYENIWSGFIYHGFLEVNWEEVARAYLKSTP